MGGVFSTSGQKTTTVFSQIPAENEVAPGIKLTNAVLNKISQGDSGLTNQQLNSIQNQYNAHLESIHAAHEQEKADLMEKFGASKFDPADESAAARIQALRAAAEAVKDASTKVEEERRQFLQIQEEEKEKIIEKTKPFFAPKDIVNPCEDLIAQVASCYRKQYQWTCKSSSEVLEDELSQADERCRLLEEKLNNMRLAFVKAETERNKEKEARIRSERERIAAIYAKTEQKQQTPISINRHVYEVAPISTKFNGFDSDESEVETAEMPLTVDSEDNEENELQKILKQNSKIKKAQKTKRKNPSPPTKTPKSNDREKMQFPFCAGSATKSHNVGLNLQGLMHQVKTQSSRRGPHYAESTSSKTSAKRKTVGGHEQNMDIATTKEIENLSTLLSELQKEFADLAVSCREKDLDCEDLQDKLKDMEKKGQHILVVKKLLKQKKSKQTTKEQDQKEIEKELNKTSPTLPMCVAAMKCDMEEKRAVDVRVAESWAMTEKVKHFNVSVMNRGELAEPLSYLASRLAVQSQKSSFLSRRPVVEEEI
ncbi:Oidioi.mRNA.OKI2018_I69.PAR.g11487.t1.cds [Oikopleura dioica]|uniref:Oidioi.mRNA.OKI2018_I69.PAR.g11487.t1.cds n=1 Tax=Oikopleura dioica TaxID=34765 RepID=A0ABN7RVY9_OIKDI|nr:Oidioi.mRNA.OKI2018_I69.PAR.g11487.t1.cds [Oikopleura dioica]